MTFSYRLTFVFLVFLLSNSPAAAQITLNDLSNRSGNSRFYNDVIPQVKHPSLSLNGFDCAGRCDKGLGLKQILEEVYSSSSSQSAVEVYDKVRSYDVLGRRVATLADRERAAGCYRTQLNAASFAAGVYVVRARLGEHVFTRKLVLTK